MQVEQTLLWCCRHAIQSSVKQLTWQGAGAEAKSILPTAQYTRAADLLTAAVDYADRSEPVGYVCKQCKVGSPPCSFHELRSLPDVCLHCTQGRCNGLRQKDCNLGVTIAVCGLIRLGIVGTAIPRLAGDPDFYLGYKWT